jgi:hypothetical protein
MQASNPLLRLSNGCAAPLSGSGHQNALQDTRGASRRASAARCPTHSRYHPSPAGHRPDSRPSQCKSCGASDDGPNAASAQGSPLRPMAIGNSRHRTTLPQISRLLRVPFSTRAAFASDAAQSPTSSSLDDKVHCPISNQLELSNIPSVFDLAHLTSTKFSADRCMYLRRCAFGELLPIREHAARQSQPSVPCFTSSPNQPKRDPSATGCHLRETGR